MANPSQKVEAGLSIRRRFVLPIVAAAANHSPASVVANPGIKSLNVPKGRRRI